jgi:hypothetical protein
MLFEVFEKLTSACLSKFHERPCYYLLIIYIKMIETIDDSPYYVFVALCIVVIVVSLIFKMAYFLS